MELSRPILGSPTTPGGMFNWLMIGIAVLVVGTAAVFYYLGYF